jgi:protein gp37
MGDKTKIAWSEASWNPMTGCTRISAGCKYCYAHEVAEKLKEWGTAKFSEGMKVNLHGGKYINLPRKWKKGRLIFVDSMGDLFHKDVPIEFLMDVWETMRDCPQHIFQILTKRAERMQEVLDRFSSIYGVLHNVWMGVTTENQKWYDHRVPYLIDSPAALRWVSMEPLIGQIIMGNLIHSLDWVVVGGETELKGKWREMKHEWVVEVMNECQRYGIPFFFKHWNANAARYAKHLLDGVAYEEYPSTWQTWIKGE